MASDPRGATMSRYSHCQECGRKVLSAYFCRKCEGAFCSLQCLEQHVQKHPAPPWGLTPPAPVLPAIRQMASQPESAEVA